MTDVFYDALGKMHTRGQSDAQVKYFKKRTAHTLPASLKPHLQQRGGSIDSKLFYWKQEQKKIRQEINYKKDLLKRVKAKIDFIKKAKGVK